MAASYALRVPQAGDLPTASFRPHLTMIALAVQLTVPVIRVRKGLAPSSECALPGAHKKREVHDLPFLSGQIGHEINVSRIEVSALRPVFRISYAL